MRDARKWQISCMQWRSWASGQRQGVSCYCFCPKRWTATDPLAPLATQMRWCEWFRVDSLKYWKIFLSGMRLRKMQGVLGTQSGKHCWSCRSLKHKQANKPRSGHNFHRFAEYKCNSKRHGTGGIVLNAQSCSSASKAAQQHWYRLARQSCQVSSSESFFCVGCCRTL